jgi:Flp pilus assembly protein TadG
MTIGQGWGWWATTPPNSRNLRIDSRGAAGVEFALILPVALILFTGAITYGDAIALDRKVTLTTHTITDLVTQYSSISSTDMTTLLNASASVVAPYSAATMLVTVSEVSTDAAGKATIVWSRATVNGTPRTVGSVVTLPSTIDTANVTYIWGEVRYTYTPAIGYQVTGPLILSDQTYMSPRISSTITLAP